MNSDTAPLPALSAEEFMSVDSVLFDRLDSISEFTHILSTTAGGGVVDPTSNTAVAFEADLRPILYEALDLASFYGHHALKIERTEDEFRAIYRDPDYHFKLILNRDGRIILSRSGSSLKLFHDWYRYFAISMPGIVDKLLDVIARNSGIAEHKPENIKIVEVSFQFQVLLGHLVDEETGQPAKNLQAMERLISQVPGSDGHLQPPVSLTGSLTSDAMAGEEVPVLGRLDAKMSRTSILPGSGSKDAAPQFAREFYQVEAPANSNWSTLWFEFDLIGRSAEAASGRRYEFDHGKFLRRSTYEEVYLGFFRDRALRGFLADVTAGLAYQSVVSDGAFSY